ncbi:hypothetical protein G9A89_014638 [Geosiphon pyriformis]|nr:hypothetical protein G9A89_014638 [Geosiphon pyriformis]
MEWPSTLASVYIAVMGFFLRAAPLNNRTGMVFLNSNEKMVANVLFSVTIAGGDLNSSGNSGFGWHQYPNSKNVILMFEVDRLLVVGVDILQMAVVNKLGSDILVLNKLAAVSLAGKCFDFALDFDIDSGFGIGNRGFNIDFPIVSYKCCSWLLCGLVYHSCGKHVFLAATADWLMLRDMLDFGNNCSFSDYCVFGEQWVHRPFGLRLVVVVAAVTVVVAVVVAEVVLVAVKFANLVVEVAAEWV